MTSNMMVGPFEMGGNLVQMDLSGVKFRVQNGQGKIKKLSADEFERQVEQNAEKIQNGEDFEFKKDNKKTLKIAAATVGTAAVVAGVIYRKEIGKFFTKIWDRLFHSDAPAGYSKAYRKARKKSFEETFKNYDPEAVLKGLKEGKTPKELGLESGATFIRREADSTLKGKRTRYMSDKNKEARKARREALIKKFEEKGIKFDFQSRFKDVKGKFTFNNDWKPAEV